MKTLEQKREELKEYFLDNPYVLTAILNEFDSYDGYLNDARFYPMDDIAEYVGNNPEEVLEKAFYGRDLDSYDKERDRYGRFNPNRDYFRFDGYGNLESTNYEDYTDLIDDYFLDKIIEEAEDWDEIKDNDDIQEILKEVEDNE